MLRSIETKIRCAETPRSASAWIVKRIMISGPTTRAIASLGSKPAGSTSDGTSACWAGAENALTIPTAIKKFTFLTMPHFLSSWIFPAQLNALEIS